MQIIRIILGAIILFADWLTTPRSIKRSASDQAFVDQEAQGLVLYQYKSCPFCVKVRRVLKRQSLKVETRDAKRNETSRNELVAGGGLLKVPCLRVERNGEVSWMYESNDIIDYLTDKFSQ